MSSECKQLHGQMQALEQEVSEAQESAQQQYEAAADTVVCLTDAARDAVARLEGALEGIHHDDDDMIAGGVAAGPETMLGAAADELAEQLHTAATSVARALASTRGELDTVQDDRARVAEELALAQAFQGVAQERSALEGQLDRAAQSVLALQQQMRPLQEDHERLRAACEAQEAELKGLRAARGRVVEELAQLKVSRGCACARAVCPPVCFQGMQRL